MKKIALDGLVSLLDDTLECSTFQDVSNNGLQIANAGTVTRVITGVDASMRLLKEAAQCGADCVICHHGISWGDSLKRITGLNHRIVAFAIQHNIALYAAHLPLDAHPRYGNNAQLCKALGLDDLAPAFYYRGSNTIGFTGTYDTPLSLEDFCERVRKEVTPELRVATFGGDRVRRVGVVSGGAADMLDQAAALGCDVFLTGEPSLQGYNLAENLGQNIVFAGHYATEIFGVRALAALVKRHFDIPAACIDFKIDY
ncbi:MAG TPA: Nif3-like dinuclear metal center hexameric protein [Kiritimatiellia bacterium]|mgnify:CR=1 FL=1|jgi:dinuclear metal center YbgI/SA1388 family protein|nr:Nif3-like dinuclear metal center hexameric protein [Kiritimatiellia bacterium]